MAELPFTPKFKCYFSCDDRKKSYRDWPKHLYPSPTELSRSGFFYRHRGDHVQCFYCGVLLKDWTAVDNVNVRHAKESKECVYLKMIADADELKENEWSLPCSLFD